MNEETTVNSNVTETLQPQGQVTQEQPQQNQVIQENSWNIPDEYKEKAWAKNIKSQEDLLKSYNTQQT